MRLFWQLMVFCTIALWADSALAQRRPIPDETLGGERSIVTPQDDLGGLPGDQISGGAQRGDNLFHSFREFGIDPGRSVYFEDPGVRNILSRVTGGNPSEIFGRLGVLGNANLFLINPSGIVFGAGASLDVGGSFVGTTADSFVFKNGFTFSATNPQAPSLLTVSVPIGLQYGTQTPGAITLNQATLLVDSGQSLILAGGNITLDGSSLLVAFPQGGRIDLGAVAGTGTVGLQQNGNIFSLSFPETLARTDVQLTNGSSINVVAENGGSVAINARNLDILGSFVQAGIRQERGAANSQAGNIVLNGTGKINVGQASRITNNVEVGGIGNTGSIDITAGSFFVTDGAQLQAVTFGRGNAGDVIITGDRILFDNGDALSTVGSNGFTGSPVGNGGNVEINTNSLEVRNGASLQASTFGRGNAGDVIITGDRILFDRGFAFSTVGSVDFTTGSPVGNGGNVEINTNSLEVRNGGQLQASTFGRGNAGDVIITGDRVLFDRGFAFSTVGSSGFTTGSPVGNGGNVEINTNSLEVRNGGQLQASTFGRGNAGDVIITGDRVLFDNGDALSRIEEGGIGRGGSININANSLVVRSGASLTASTRGQGNAGDVIITGDRVLFNNGDAFSRIEEGGIGRGGSININANSLVVRSGASLTASTRGQGNAGDVIITGDRVLFDRGFAFSTVGTVGFTGSPVGNGGNVEINTNSLEVRNGGQLQASTFGRGNAGDVIITGDRVLFDGVGNGFPSAAFSKVEVGAIGRGGNINIDTNSLVVRNGASLTASTFGRSNTGIVNAETALRGGNVTINASTFEVTNGGRVSTTTNGDGRAGNITLDVTDRITLSGSDRQRTSGLFANTRGNSSGRGGTIRITTGQLEISDRAGVVTNSRGSGVAGNIDITAQSLQLDRGNITAGTRQNRVDGGNIRLQDVDLLQLRNRSNISTNAGGNGGDITLDADFIVAVPNENSDISANAIGGDGGNVNITSEGLFGIERRDLSTNLSDITATSERGVQGDININTPNVDPSRGLVQLPIAPIDASNQIARNCPISGNVAGERGEFIVSGRGGMPSNPAEILGGETLLTDLAEIEGEGQGSRTTGETSDRTAVSPSAKTEIVEAQGWVVGADGKVRLTTDNPVEPHRPPIAPVLCPSS